MNIKKILMYVIFAFVMILPFSVSAEEVEYDFKFNTSKLNMVDYDYLNKLKVSGYNAIISRSEYKEEHSVIESYNEFYLNHGYYIGYGPDGELGIFYDMDCDYLSLYVFYVNVIRYPDQSGLNSKFFIGLDYDYWFTSNNVGEVTLKRTNGFYSWVDKNINNTDFVYDYNYSDLRMTNSELPEFYYPVLGTNRSYKFITATSNDAKSRIFTFLYDYISKDASSDFYYTDLVIKSLNSKPGNIFRHPYSTEETEKTDSNKTSTVISINSSNYSKLQLKYTISSSTTRKWNDYLFFWKYDKKATLDWLNIQITSSNTISYPRRYSGYKKGTDIEMTKMPNDFGSTLLSTNYAASISSLGGANGVVKGYFDFDLRDLPENTIITIYLEYDPEYVQFEPIELPEVNFIEYDLTGKYAVGLVPKFTYSNNTFSLLYQGNFTTYYAFNANNYNVYDSETIKSIGDYSKKTISFSNFSDTELYEKPIFYIMNNLYSDDTQVSKIKYNPNYFELLVYENIDDVIISDYTDHSYESPSQNFNSSDSGLKSNEDSNSLIDFSELFASLPDFIVSLGSAFTAICMCIMIAFDSLPAVVQSVFMFCLLVSAIVLVVKLLK